MKQIYRKIFILLGTLFVILPCALILMACGGASKPEYVHYAPSITGNQGKEIYLNGANMTGDHIKGDEIDFWVDFLAGWEHANIVVKINGEDVTAQGKFYYADSEYSISDIVGEPDYKRQRRWRYLEYINADMTVEVDVSACEKITLPLRLHSTVADGSQIWVIRPDVEYVNVIDETTATKIENVNGVFEIPYDSEVFLLSNRKLSNLKDIYRNWSPLSARFGMNQYYQDLYYVYYLSYVHSETLWVNLPGHNSQKVETANVLTVLADDDESITYTAYSEEQVISGLTSVTLNNTEVYPLYAGFRDGNKYTYVYLGDADNYSLDPAFDESQTFYCRATELPKNLYLELTPKGDCNLDVVEFVLEDYAGHAVVIEPQKVGKKYYLVATREQLAPLCTETNGIHNGEIRVYGRLKAAAVGNYVAVKIYTDADQSEYTGNPFLREHIKQFRLNGTFYCSRADLCTFFQTQTWNGTIQLTVGASIEVAGTSAGGTVSYFDQNHQLLYCNRTSVSGVNGGQHNSIKMLEGQSAENVCYIEFNLVYGRLLPPRRLHFEIYPSLFR